MELCNYVFRNRSFDNPLAGPPDDVVYNLYALSFVYNLIVTYKYIHVSPELYEYINNNN